MLEDRSCRHDLKARNSFPGGTWEWVRESRRKLAGSPAAKGTKDLFLVDSPAANRTKDPFFSIFGKEVPVTRSRVQFPEGGKLVYSWYRSGDGYLSTAMTTQVIL